MSRAARLLFVATLVFASGCAKQDWIERTLVTVDVTGTWYGSVGGEGGFARDLIFELEQTGSRVTGSMRYNTTTGTTASSNAGARPGPIAGTVTGDVFRFRQTDGGVEGELTVSGDEMIGLVSFVGNRTFSMRRIDSTSRPSAPPRQ
jgi:hypothetical protein